MISVGITPCLSDGTLFLHRQQNTNLLFSQCTRYTGIVDYTDTFFGIHFSPTMMATKPDQGYAYVILLSCFLGHFIILGVCYSMGVFYVQFREVFRDSEGSVALMSSLSTAFLFTIAPLASILTNRFGPRAVCFGGGLISGLAFLLSIFANSVYILYITFGVLPGIGLGLAYVPSVTTLGGYFVKWRTLAFGLAVSGSGLGNLALSPFFQFLLDLYGWRGSCFILSGISLNLCVVGMLMKPMISDTTLEKPANEDKSCQKSLQNPQVLSLEESKFVSSSLISLHSHHDFHPHTDQGDPEVENGGVMEKQETTQKVSRIKRYVHILGVSVLKNLSFILLCASQACVHVGTITIYTHLAAYAVFVAKLSAYQGSLLLSFNGVGSLVGRVLAGVIASLTTISEPCIYILFFLMSGVVVATVPLTVNFPLLVCIGFVFGMSYGAQCTVLPQLIISTVGLQHLVTGFGYVCIFAGVGCLVGSPVAELLFEETGVYSPSFYLAGAILILSAVLMVYPWLMIRSNKYGHK